MLQIAKIIKSDGTDGGLLISARGIDLEDIDIQEPVYIEFDGLPVPFFIEDLRPKGNSKAVIHVTDIRTLQDSEELVGKAVLSDSWTEEDDDANAFVGWTVLNRGAEFGTVADIEPFPGNPCLCVETPGGEVMVPLHEDLIISADQKTRRLDMNIPEGLI